jgi:hypothetical protein
VGAVRLVVRRPVSVCWHVRAAAFPAALKSCPRCDARRRFHSSDQFRVNASGRKLDVWLIYRCERCDFIWNRTVEERRTVSELGARLARYERNDHALARAVACDVAGLAALGIESEAAAASVDRPALPAERPARLAIRFAVEAGCELRLDRLLARELALPRSAIEAALHRSNLVVPDARALRRPVRDGLELVIALPCEEPAGGA